MRTYYSRFRSVAVALLIAAFPLGAIANEPSANLTVSQPANTGKLIQAVRRAEAAVDITAMSTKLRQDYAYARALVFQHKDAEETLNDIAREASSVGGFTLAGIDGEEYEALRRVNDVYWAQTYFQDAKDAIHKSQSGFSYLTLAWAKIRNAGGFSTAGIDSVEFGKFLREGFTNYTRFKFIFAFIHAKRGEDMQDFLKGLQTSVQELGGLEKIGIPLRDWLQAGGPMLQRDGSLTPPDSYGPARSGFYQYTKRYDL